MNSNDLVVRNARPVCFFYDRHPGVLLVAVGLDGVLLRRLYRRSHPALQPPEFCFKRDLWRNHHIIGRSMKCATL